MRITHDSACHAMRDKNNETLENDSLYQIVDASIVYSPKPAKGGTTNSRDIPQTFQMWGDDQKPFLVWQCHDLSKRTTDRYLTHAILAIVNNELNPMKLRNKMKGL